MTDTNADVALLTEQRYTAAVAAEGNWYLDNILRDDQLLQTIRSSSASFARLRRI